MKSKKGFTLIELVIGLVIGAALAGLAYTLIAPTENWLFSEARRSGMGEGEVAMTRMVREIRRVKSPSSIATYAPTQFTFVDYDDNMVDFEPVGIPCQVLHSIGNTRLRHIKCLLCTILVYQHLRRC